MNSIDSDFQQRGTWIEQMRFRLNTLSKLAENNTSTLPIGLAEGLQEMQTLLEEGEMTAQKQARETHQVLDKRAVALDNAGLSERRTQENLSEQQRTETALHWELLVNASLSELSGAMLGSGVSLKENSELFLRYALQLSSSKYGFVSVIDSKTGTNVIYAMTALLAETAWITQKDQQVVLQTEAEGHPPYPWAQVLKTREVFYINPPDVDETTGGLLGKNVALKNLLAVPALVDGKPAGMVAIFNAKDHYTVRELEAVKQLTDLFAVAVQRWQMEQALHENVARLESIFRAAPVGIVLLSKRVFLHMNAHFCKILGYEPHELLGQSARLCYMSEDAYEEVGKALYAQITVQGTGMVETCFRRKDGAIRNVLLMATFTDPEDPQIGMTSAVLDITERKIMEEALRNNEERLNSIISSAMDAIIIVDEAQKIVLFNPAAENMFGYSSQEILGEPLARIIPENYRAPHANHIKTFSNTNFTQRAKSMGNHALNLVALRANNEVFPVDISISQSVLGGRKLFTSIVRDISERKKAESALQENRARLQTLLENAMVGIYETDLQGNCIYVNGAWCKFTGLTPAQAIGQGWGQALHPQDYEFVSTSWYAAAEVNQNWSMEYRLCTPEGVVTWVQGTVKALRAHGEHIGYVGTNTDITQRILAQQELQESERRFRELMENVHLVAVMLDTQGRITFCNEYLLQLAGWQCEEVMGQDWFERFTLPKEEVKTFFLDALEQKAIPTHVENVLLTRKGEQRWIAWNNTLLRTQDGTIVGSASIGEDITERKRTEVALQQAININQKRQNELEILNKVSMALRQIEKPDMLQTLLFKEIEQLFQIDAGALLFSEEQDWRYEFIQGSEEFKHWLPLQDALTGSFSRVNIDKGTVLLPNQPFDMDKKALIAIVPFKSHESILGGMVLCWLEPHEFTPEAQRLLNTLAEMGGLALHRMRVLEALKQRVADRSLELAVLYNIAAVANQSLDLPDVLEKSLLQVMIITKSKIGLIHMLDENNQTFQLSSHLGLNPSLVAEVTEISKRVVQQIIKHNTPQHIDIDNLTFEWSPSESTSVWDKCAYIGVPIRSKERIIGVVSTITEQGASFNSDSVSVLSSIADHIGIAIENVRHHDQAQQIAILHERQRLARDLHDSVTQSLFSIVLMAGSMSKLIVQSENPNQAATYFEKLSQTALLTLKEMRLLVYELRPVLLENEGLIGALRRRLDAVETRAQVEAKLVVDDIPELLSSHEEAGLYYVVQEALNNALKHSASTSVKVHIYKEKHWLILEIIDNGKGFNVEELSNNGGQGLRNMHERVKALGGKLVIDSEIGQGTKIKIQIRKPAMFK